MLTQNQHDHEGLCDSVHEPNQSASSSRKRPEMRKRGRRVAVTSCSSVESYTTRLPATGCTRRPSSPAVES